MNISLNFLEAVQGNGCIGRSGPRASRPRVSAQLCLFFRVISLVHMWCDLSHVMYKHYGEKTHYDNNRVIMSNFTCFPYKFVKEKNQSSKKETESFVWVDLRTIAQETVDTLGNCSEEVRGEVSNVLLIKRYMQPSTHLSRRLLLVTRNRYLRWCLQCFSKYAKV